MKSLLCFSLLCFFSSSAHTVEVTLKNLDTNYYLQTTFSSTDESETFHTYAIQASPAGEMKMDIEPGTYSLIELKKSSDGRQADITRLRSFGFPITFTVSEDQELEIEAQLEKNLGYSFSTRIITQ